VRIAFPTMVKRKKRKIQGEEVTEFMKRKKILSKVQFVNEEEREYMKGQNRRKRPWTDKEFEDLKKGVARHGLKWTAILRDPEFKFAKDRLSNDLNSKWTWARIRAKPEDYVGGKRKQAKKKMRWGPEETLELMKGVYKHGTMYKKMLEDPELNFQQGRTNIMLESKCCTIVRKNRLQKKQRLHIMIDLHPHHAIVLKVAKPHQAYMRLRNPFDSQYRFMLFDLESEIVHTFNRKQKLFQKKATSEQRKHVKKLLRQFSIDTETKLETLRFYYFKILFWKTKDRLQPRKYLALVQRTLKGNEQDYLNVKKRKRTQELLEDVRARKKARYDKEFEKVMAFSNATDVKWSKQSGKRFHIQPDESSSKRKRKAALNQVLSKPHKILKLNNNVGKRAPKPRIQAIRRDKFSMLSLDLGSLESPLPEDKEKVNENVTLPSIEIFGAGKHAKSIAEKLKQKKKSKKKKKKKKKLRSKAIPVVF